jgi:fructan beta-fructosidase
MKNWLMLLGLYTTILSCKNEGAVLAEEEPESPFNEKLRPQYHFTPPSNWMNDPNGMVFYEDTYHLFYQHHPDSTIWGPMHWGHATSNDLIKWEHQPIAFYPDSMGYIFSGSAVLDQHNSSGLGSMDNPPLVAIFTYHHPERADSNQLPYQTQALAFSLDRGLTWEKYQGNPVLVDSTQSDFRDPKVMWYEQGDYWVMTLAVKNRVAFYRSDNLIDWVFLSDFGEHQGYHEGVWECPDLFSLTADQGNEKWVLLVSVGSGGERGSATQYFIGDFDGTTFKADNNEIRWLDYGRDNYAGVTWSNTNGREKTYIGWSNNWDYANQIPTGGGWRGAMTLPRNLDLVSSTTGYSLSQQPVESVANLRQNTTEIKRQIVSIEADWTSYMSGTNGMLELELQVRKIGSKGTWFIRFGNYQKEYLEIGYDELRNEYYIDRSQSGEVEFSEKFPQVNTAPRKGQGNVMNLRVFMDRSIIEVFADDGRTVLTNRYFPSTIYSSCTFHVPEGSILTQGYVHQMKRIWPDFL